MCSWSSVDFKYRPGEYLTISYKIINGPGPYRPNGQDHITGPKSPKAFHLIMKFGHETLSQGFLKVHMTL